ncbi:MAG TPA: PASTA domain-containing protein [Thermoleophilaceae bacterium]|jgi:hypothetical protein
MARLVSLAFVAASLCAIPAVARAEVSTFGSDLSAPAAISAEHGSDTSYWNEALPAGGIAKAPADGQVTVVKLKGALLPNPRQRRTEAERLAQIIHFQVLRPKGEERYKIVALSTGHLEIPLSDSPEGVVTRYEPVNLCVRKGEIVAFNTIGAHEYRRDLNHQGADYQVFGRVPDAVTQWYEKDNGLNEGTVFDPDPLLFPPMNGVELLVQTVLATGPDATDICPGGYQQHVFRGLQIDPPSQPSVKTKTRVARLKGTCHGENYGGCFGKLSLDATIDGAAVHLGDARFSIRNATTEVVEVPLSPDDLLKIQRAKRLTGEVTAEAHDDPRADDRVKWDSVPVQSLTTSDKVSLVPDKPPCVVPKVLGKSLSVAKRKIKAAGCAVGQIKRKKDKSKAGKVIAQTRAPKLVLPTGSRVGLTVGTK